MRKIEKTLKKRRQQLLNYPNVVMVGVGKKIKNGRDTGLTSIVVSVREKKGTKVLLPEETIPESVDGVYTDVQETGEIVPLSILAEAVHNNRQRPVMPGISIGHKDITAGTLGLIVFDKASGEMLMLSNNHVFADVDKGNLGDDIIQPGRVDGGIAPQDTVGYLCRFVRLYDEPPKDTWQDWLMKLINAILDMFGSSKLYVVEAEEQKPKKVDAAVAMIRDSIVVLANTIGLDYEIVGTIEPHVGMPVYKTGRTTGYTEGEVMQTDVTVKVKMDGQRYVLFEDQIALTRMSDGGDSGSAILYGNTAVGLLFAGSDTMTVANRMSNVMKELNVKVSHG